MIKKFVLLGFLTGFMMVSQAKDYVIDVRSPEEIAQTGKVEGALVSNMRDPDFLAVFKSFKIDPENDVVKIYCRSGKRASVVKEALEQMGYRNVQNLGGYEAAAQLLNKPLVK